MTLGWAAEAPVLIAAGFAAGLVNTLASSGSAIALPALMLLGLPPLGANATNRLSILFGSLMAVRTFQTKGLIDWSAGRRMVVPGVAGSAIGVAAAEMLPGRDMGLLITAALMVALLLLFTKVKAVLARPQRLPVELTRPELAILFAVSIWLGFLALDGNTYLLLVLMGLCHFDLPHANALKVVMLVVTSLVPVAMFTWSGSIWWTEGLILSVGSLAGAHIGATLSSHPQARRWVFRLLVVAISLEVIHLGVSYVADFTTLATTSTPEARAHPYTAPGHARPREAATAPAGPTHPAARRPSD
ncbi:MAG: sulfite exporter TauE/SafE family protein [Acetobacteraceae bacterium]